MTANKLYRILHIVTAYEPDSCICAEHDQIWFGPRRGDMKTRDRDALEDLGAWWDETTESWSVYV